MWTSLALIVSTTLTITHPLVQSGQISEPQVRLTGRVTSLKTGAPLSGALVSVRSGSRSIAVRTVQTDAAGEFAVDVSMGPVGMTAWAKGHATISRSLELSGPEYVDLPLPIDRPVRGTIVDAAGRPVPQVRVRLVPITPRGRAQVLETVTRLDGTYQFRGTDPSQTYRIQAAMNECPWRTLRTASMVALAGTQSQRDTLVGCR
jgi:hypothetical protein